MQTDDSRILALAQNINTSIGNLKESKNLRIPLTQKVKRKDYKLKNEPTG